MVRAQLMGSRVEGPSLSTSSSMLTIMTSGLGSRASGAAALLHAPSAPGSSARLSLPHPSLGVGTPDGQEATGLLRSLSDRWKFGGR